MQGVARLCLVSITLCGAGCATKTDVWLRCTLTETLTTVVPGTSTAPVEEDLDHTYVFVFNSRNESLERYDGGRLQDLSGPGLVDGIERTGSVVVTPADITYNYTLSPRSAEFSQVIDRTTLAIVEHGSSVNDTTSLASLPRKSWKGGGQCTKIRPQSLRKRQI